MNCVSVSQSVPLLDSFEKWMESTYIKAQEVNPREWLNDVIARLPYYQEKDSGKDIRELLPDVWKLKKSNENPIEV